MPFNNKRAAIGSTNFKYKGKNVSVRVFSPTNVEPGRNEYSCEFEMTGKSINYIDEAIGFDSMQALILALTKIGTYIQNNDEIDGDAIEWENGQLYFPVFTN